MKGEILSLYRWPCLRIRLLLKHIEQSFEVRCVDVLENACFGKSVVETQISQKMISPRDTGNNVTNRVCIGSFINKYN